MKTTLLHPVALAAAFACGLAVAPSVQSVEAGVAPGTGGPAAVPRGRTLTKALVDEFHEAWNDEDIPAMAAQLQPTAFFFSPHQLRYGRDTMVETVLVTNPPVLKNARTAERHSYVSDELAWSIGDIVTGDPERSVDEGAQYLYVFTRDPDRAWKLQMLVYQE